MYSAIAVAFLILYLIVGVYAGRKTNSVSDYYVMSRSAPAYQICGTLIATNASSVTLIGYTSDAFSMGPLPMVTMWGTTTIASLILGLWIGKYLYRMNLSTIPEFFVKRFPSKSVQLLASLIVLFSMVFYVVSVLLGTNVALQSLLGWSPTVSLIVVLGLITLFTVIGGMRSVVITDTVMFFVFMGSALFLGSAIFVNLGGFSSAIEKASESFSHIFSWKGNMSFYAGFMHILEINILSLILVMGSPQLLSRMSIAKGERELGKAMVYLAVLIPIFAIALVYSFGYLPLINGTIDSTDAYPWVANNLVPTIVGALALSGVMAAAISTSSSLFQQAASTLSSDIYKRYFKPNMSDEEFLKVSRMSVVIIALFVLIFALIPQIGSASIVYAFLFATSAFAAWLPSLILGVLWKGATTKGSFWSMLVALMATLSLGLTRMFEITPDWLAPNVVGLITATVIMIVVSKADKQSSTLIEDISI